MKMLSSYGASGCPFGNLLRATNGGNQYSINDAILHVRAEFRPLLLSYQPRACDLPALEQATCLGALKAADRFDPKRSNDFSAFARMAILGSIRDELDRISRNRILLVGDLFPGENGTEIAERESVCDSPFDQIEGEEAFLEMRSSVRRWIAKRPWRQREYIGLHFDRGLRKAEAARMMKISKAAVTKLHNAIICAGRNGLAGMKGYLTRLN